MILAGQGALGAAAALVELAERTGTPVLTTPSARGIIAETSPLAMGFDVLRGALAAANALIAQADRVLVLGAKLGHNGSAGFGLVIPPEKLVRVDQSPAALAATYPAAHGLAMDVGAFLARSEPSEHKASVHGPPPSSRVARAAIRAGDPRNEPDIAGVAAA